ncbi:MAG: hypothetical protein PWQ15_1608 [Methanobacterium sp.]|jgi:uncharacterized membrane protein|uniref:DUF2178 domain-containing protein n=1 Tax=Methanobacterium sp. TaxID=2164 RepID=UPI0003C9A166|nr:DUF2178 domain-containing protein [Methanobacterium sp.]MDI3550505.1 hypothetical protein [Methanobacterium sp.]CDG64527.1 putative membrane protein [Methanobacterium sp. MB1]
MDLKILRIILTAASGLGTILWVSGMILANIYLVIAALVLVVVILPLVYSNRNNMKDIFQGKDAVVLDDERTQMINERASNLTMGVYVAVMLYIAVIIITMRNVYPQYTVVGYAIFLSLLFALVLYAFARWYYTRKY